MSDQATIIEGASCEHCGGPVVSMSGALSCGSCGATAGLVTLAADLQRHHDAIATDVNVNTRRAPRGKKQTRTQAALDRLNNQTLFDPIVKPRSDNRHGWTSSATRTTRLPAKPLRVRMGRTRCVACDRLLVARGNKVMCPGCGMIVADIGILNYLRDELGAVPDG